MPRFSRRALPLTAAVTLLASSAGLAGVIAGGGATAAGAAGAPRKVVFGPVNFALSNWGGYIAQGTSGEFTSAVAHWKIAKSTCKSSADLYAPWVGIDGDGDATVEQTGVATDCSSGSPKNEAWYEMYPAAPVYFSNGISAGDSISASVTYASGEFTLKISDVTKKWTHVIHKKQTDQRLCAEAIIEAPGGGGTFPTFTSINFTGVKFNGQPLGTFNPTASDTGTTSHELVPSAITNGDDFKMVPKA
jgi:hypothetical protein